MGTKLESVSAEESVLNVDSNNQLNSGENRLTRVAFVVIPQLYPAGDYIEVTSEAGEDVVFYLPDSALPEPIQYPEEQPIILVVPTAQYDGVELTFLPNVSESRGIIYLIFTTKIHNPDVNVNEDVTSSESIRLYDGIPVTLVSIDGGWYLENYGIWEN